MKLLKPIPHPNADRLEGFIINGNRVWYSKDLLKEGDTVIYFPIECQINPEILSNLNLFSDKTLNADNTKSGYFGHQGRVKAVKLRGEPSEGFIMTIDDFESAIHVRIDSLPVDVEFDTFGDMWICRKYEPAPARNSGTGPKAKKNPNSIIADEQFRFHYDTKKLSDNIGKIELDDIIVITNKMHGTSAVFANVLTKRKLNWKERIAKWFGIPVIDKEYNHVYSSRTVIKYIEDKYHTSEEGYYSNDVWGKVYNDDVAWCLDPGISIYGEIVGYSSYDKMVQKGYDYGESAGSCQLYVYRITYTTPDGDVIEFSWDQIKQFCYKNLLKHVPELYHGTAKNWFNNNTDLVTSDIYQIPSTFFLQSLKDAYLEKQCDMCKNNVPAEGIVVRRESRGIEAWKLKSFAFLQRESAELDNAENTSDDV